MEDLINIESIKIKIEDKSIELSLTQARKLYSELSKIFQTNTTFVPYYVPYHPYYVTYDTGNYPVRKTEVTCNNKEINL